MVKRCWDHWSRGYQSTVRVGILEGVSWKGRSGRKIRKNIGKGAWVAQSVKHPTLDFSSGHDLTVVRLSPAWGSALREKPA